MNHREPDSPSTPQACALGAAKVAPFFGDAEREELIALYCRAITLEPNEAMKRMAFGRMAALIGERSPAQVAKMEREKGLR